MEIHKFGGASIKDSASIKNVCKLIKETIKTGTLVVSAMGKSTNLLEKLTFEYYNKKQFETYFREFINGNFIIANDLFSENDAVWKGLDKIYTRLKTKLNEESSSNLNFEYDQIVPYGELVSSAIVSAYLKKIGVEVNYISAFNIIKTDSNFREANVDWDQTSDKIAELITNKNQLYITQGFIGSDKNNLPVTLGREGSDFTAAILGSVLNAKKVSVWKDVPGIMSADPAWIPDSELLHKLSFHESIELAFFGAKVIHPKTIKPLQNRSIPLHVRSFIDTQSSGTLIGDFELGILPPVFVRKQNQVLISIWQTDFSFIVEKNLSHIFGIFHEFQVKVNIMQNSAISFSICVDDYANRAQEAIKKLKEKYHVKYNDGLELISIRHNRQGAEERILKDKTVLLEQKSRSTARFVVRAN